MKCKSIEIIQYKILGQFDNLFHFTTTRKGGVSDGNYATFNLGRFSGDKDENIQENFSHLYQEIGISSSQLHLPYQTHENFVQKIDLDFLRQNPTVQAQKLYGFDALITNLPNRCIGVSTADCVPVLLYDPVKKAIAAVHAGWRGTCLRVIENTIEALSDNYQSNPSDIIALIGPSISPEVYEVGDEVFMAFKKEGFDIEKIFFKKREKFHLDLWEANKTILMEAGVKAENIEISGLCTFTLSNQFFSARKLGIHSGRIVSGIMIK